MGEVEWPQLTKEWCFHCCNDIVTTPIPSPVDVGTDGVWTVQPHRFCSWNCVMADTTTNSLLLWTFYKACNGIWPFGLRPCPPRAELASFGGAMSFNDEPQCRQPRRHREALAAKRDWTLCGVPPLRYPSATFQDGVWVLGKNRHTIQDRRGPATMAKRLSRGTPKDPTCPRQRAATKAAPLESEASCHVGQLTQEHPTPACATTDKLTHRQEQLRLKKSKKKDEGGTFHDIISLMAGK